jgi:DNA-binding YbaB/EbfC family protein
MSSMGKFVKQAARMQQQMQERMAEVEAALAVRTVEATSGGGAVKVTARCDGTLSAIKIDPAAITPGDPSMVEDMVLTAANQALEQAKKISSEEMGRVTQGLNLPGLPGLL